MPRIRPAKKPAIRLNFVLGDAGESGSAARVWIESVGSSPPRRVSRRASCARSDVSPPFASSAAGTSATRDSRFAMRLSSAACSLSVCSSIDSWAKPLATSWAALPLSAVAVIETMLLWATGS